MSLKWITSRLFYGWYIVAAGMLLLMYYAGLFIFGFTAFMGPLAATFGWNYTLISLAVSLRGVETGVLNPLLGIIVDRWPARRLVLIGVIIIGLGVLGMSQVTNLAMFYTTFLITALGSSLAIIMVPTVTISRWFKKKVGMATGILAMGSGMGGIMVPVLTNMIDIYGWRMVLITSGIGIWVLGIPLSFIFVDKPEDRKLSPDGKLHIDSENSNNLRPSVVSMKVKDAVKTRAFWYIGIATMLQMTAVSAPTVHIMPYLSSLGLDRSSSSIITMLVPAISMASRVPFGILADVFDKRYVLALCIGLISLGEFLFWIVDINSWGSMILFTIVFGFGMGGLWSTRTPIIREYFGTKSFGAIFGLISIFITVGSLASPPIAGWIFDTLGNYGPIWPILGAGSMIGAILILLIPEKGDK